ncbi:S-adenosyl-L-methionine:salicylic acid carboxyl methyltransferase [Candidatus Rhodobacter oscarellae]|uniref:S-adenosyl-L-methionine:salicylic acid carboxyl methyltransferase n=1 Tax=Candidatus Rhodobacter oscarellae TaxID=1675527 RepID=A0A0J9EBQ8_9RHOB|nr:hypothetical protein [Candidatus Rhodobacter lobularis]KMW60197.1 S-adenosyl-L-methionine:salicylic acid carboxyl methyltransferase [Candidatus Rhodobacter lobularis]
MGKDTKSFMAMKGAGYYSRATIGAKHVMDNAAELVLDAVARMDPADDATMPFRITDMGAADGGTSLDLWRRVLGDIRARAPGRPIEIIYTDLPRNDFAQTFQNVHGLTGLKTYADEVPGVHVLASGTSFHQQILPAGTLDLGFSSTASHYITHVPGPIAEHVHMVGAAPGERALYAAKGAQDWEAMLLHRVAEMRPGARLCLFNFGIDAQGRYLGNTGGVNMFDTFARLWGDLRDRGVITGQEFRDTNFPQVYRTEAEFTAPLLDKNGPVHRAGLRLEHVEARVVRCPFEQDFTERHGDAAAFAEAYIPTLRSWSEPTFAAGLDSARPEEERADILNAFYAGYQSLVAAEPEGHAMDYVHIYLVARKAG